jgi:hypothetical protein
MSNSIIRAELETRLKAWADAQVPLIPVAFENVPFTKPSDGVFLEPLLIPLPTADREVTGTSKRFTGLFRVNCWARSGRGMGQVEKLAQNVISLFPLLPKRGSVSIESTPYSDNSVQDGTGWVVVPVTIKYRMEI